MPHALATASKADLRTAALAARDALSEAQRAEAAQALAARGLPIETKPGAVVAGYSPIRSELDPTPLMQALAAQGARLALPVITARGLRPHRPPHRLWRRSLRPHAGAAAQIERLCGDRAGLFGPASRRRAGAAARRAPGLCANGNESVRFPESVICAFSSSVTWSAGPDAPLFPNICLA